MISWGNQARKHRGRTGHWSKRHWSKRGKQTGGGRVPKTSCLLFFCSLDSTIKRKEDARRQARCKNDCGVAEQVCFWLARGGPCVCTQKRNGLYSNNQGDTRYIVRLLVACNSRLRGWLAFCSSPTPHWVPHSVPLPSAVPFSDSNSDLFTLPALGARVSRDPSSLSSPLVVNLQGQRS